MPTDETQAAANPDRDQILQYLPRLEGRALTLTRNQADAADLVQDTLEKALRALPKLRPGSTVGAWLETLLSHTFIDRWRWNGRRSRAFGCVDVDVAAPEPELPPAWLDITEAEVRAAAERLPVSFAAVFRLHDLGHVPYAEIARRLGLPTGTVGTRLRRARQRLREILIDEVLAPRPITSARAAAAAGPADAGEMVAEKAA
jgi:RNA polymerase sigma-70 factor (ECF subfamily)